MDWKSFSLGFISAFVILLALASFGFAHIGSINGSAISDSYWGSSTSASDMPEKCKVPAGQDVAGWKEHLGHHAETRDCLEYYN